MAEGRANIGSVSVSVVPDASGFSTKLNKDITPQAKALGEKIGKQIAESIAAKVSSGISDGLKESAPKTKTESDKQGADAGGAFAKAFRAKLDASLKALPKVQINADSTDADRKIADIRAALESLRDKRIGVDIDENVAFGELTALREQLESLTAGHHTVAIRTDAAEALARIDEVLAKADRLAVEEPTIKVDADTAGADAALAGTAAEADALGGAASNAGGGFSGLIAAGIALGPALIPVIAAVTAAVAGLISILGAGLIGVAVLAVAFSGVSKAVGLLDQNQNKAATSGRSLASSANAIAGAQQQVQSAEESLKNTRANAATAAIRSAEAVKNAKQAEAQAVVTAAQQTQAAEANVVTAEQNLTQAQQSAQQAQVALTQARADAAAQAQDLANQVVDGQLAQQQATIDVTNAQSALNTAQTSGTATATQLQQAALDVATANQRLAEVTLSNQRLADQKAKSDKAGIDGSTGVVAAQQTVTQANQAVVDSTAKVAAAQKAVVDIQKAGAASIIKAQQQVTDAIRSQADQQRQSAFSVQQALASVASAQRAVAQASQGSGGGGGGLTTAANQFAKLSPQVQAFAHFVHDQLEPAFKHIQEAAAKGLLPGVQKAFEILLPVLPGLATFVGNVAKALGALFVQGAKALTSPFWTQFFGFVSTNAIPALQGIATFLLDVAEGFAGLIEAFLPVTQSVGGGILGLAADFATFGAQAGQPGSPFQTFLSYVQTYAPVVVDFFGQLFDLVGNLITVFTPYGTLLLQVLDVVGHLINALGPTGLAFVLAAVGAVVLIIGGPISVLIAAFTALAGGAIYLYQNVKPIHDFVDQKLLPIFHELSDYFTGTVLPILKKIGGEALDGIKSGIATVAAAITAHKPELEELYGTFKQAAEYIVEHVLPLLGPLLKKAFETAGTTIAGFITVVSGIVDVFDAVVAAAPGVWDGIHHAFSLGVHDVLQVVHDFIDTLNSALGTIGVHIPNFTVPGIYNAPSTPPGSHGAHFGAAGGGVLPGYSPGVDSVPAMLSPGEGVLVPEAVRLLGTDWVYAINAATSGRTPGGMRGFAAGGIIGDIGSGIKNIGSSLAGAAVNPLIDKAESAARAVINSQIGPGIFRDMADGTVNLIGNAVKLSGGGVLGVRSGMPLSLVGAAQGSTHNELTFVNNHQPVTPSVVVAALNQHAALHQAPLFAGAGISGF